MEHAQPSWLSRLFLSWLTPYIKSGYHSPLKSDEMAPLRKDLASGPLSLRAFSLWDAAVERSAVTSTRPSLFKVAWALHKVQFTAGCIFGAMQGVLNNSARPMLLKTLIIALVPTSGWTDSEILLLLVAFGLVALLEGWCKLNLLVLVSVDVGNAYSSWLMSLVQRKATRVQPPAGTFEDAEEKNDDDDDDNDDNDDEKKKKKKKKREKENAANESALLGNDLLQQLELLKWSCHFPSALSGFIFGTATLIYLLGRASFVGLGTMALTLGFNRYSAHLGSKVTKLDLEAASERISVMREVIHNIVPVKFLGWEQPYLDALTAKRAAELRQVLKYRLLLVVSITLGRVSPVLAACATFTFMGAQGEELNAATVFSALAAFNALRMPLITLPLNLMQFGSMRVSIRRIEDYLLRPNRQRVAAPGDVDVMVQFESTDVVWATAEEEGTQEEEKKGGGDRKGDAGGGRAKVMAADSEIERSGGGAAAGDYSAVEVRDALPADGAIESEEAGFTLSGVNLCITRGQLVAIAGRVGSGKSTLLGACVGICRAKEGSIRVRTADEGNPGVIGYVSQKPFVLSGTVLENILMGRPRDEAELERAVACSAFAADVASMPAGLLTEIGEEGTTLSGGQQQRLSIARAIYGDPALLIVDDCLAAVDAQVASTIFSRVFKGRKERGRTTVVALNQLHFLKENCWDRIVFLESEYGKGASQESKTSDHRPSSRGGSASSLSSSSSSSSPFLGIGPNQASVVAQGTYSELLQGCPAFATMVASAPGSSQTVDDLRYDAGSSGDGAATVEQVDPPVDPINHLNPADDEAALKAVGKLTQEEKRQMGAIGLDPIRRFYKALGGPLWLAGGVCLAISAYSLMGGTDLWLAAWVSSDNTLSTTTRCIGFAAFSIGQALLIATLSFYNACATNRASSRLHLDCVTRLMHAPSSWYEETPSGRIVSRFSGDLSTVDHFFSYVLDDAFQFVFLILSLVVVVCILVPMMTPLVVLNFFAFYFAVVAVDRTNREAKRCTNVALSPLMTNISETASARSLIHAMDFGAFFCERQRQNIDNWVRFNHFSGSVVQWGVLVSSLIGFVLSTSACLFIFLQRNRFDDPAIIGVALNYTTIMPYFLSILSLILMLLFNGATCVERVLEYAGAELPQEPAWFRPDDPPPRDWPRVGSLSFEKVRLKYRPHLPYAVDGVSFSIRPGEHVGVVGRTGAGKSSLVSLLFRVVECTEGEIRLDGRDLSQLGLRTLRRAIAIITQTPLLLPGSLRHNLDPFDKFSDAVLNKMLGRAGLTTAQLGESASDLSAGEKQLMALARLLLLKDMSPPCSGGSSGGCGPQLLVLDEPTANIDALTDAKVQKVIQESFAGVSTLTIAHRLETVIASDRVLVLDKGRVAEFDTAANLLSDPKSQLSVMVDASGPEAAASLRRQANEAAKEFAKTERMMKAEKKKDQ